MKANKSNMLKMKMKMISNTTLFLNYTKNPFWEIHTHTQKDQLVCVLVLDLVITDHCKPKIADKPSRKKERLTMLNNV